MMKKAKSIEEYLAQLPTDQRIELEKLRKLIKSIIPEAKEKIGYGIPTFTYHGNLVHYAAYPKHLSFYPGSREVTEKFLPKLKGFKTAAATIQYTIDNPIPDSIVEEIVRERVKQNENNNR
jgi:uncharacterized protein YdhG (YjbR/CyaY superfamily)